MLYPIFITAVNRMVPFKERKSCEASDDIGIVFIEMSIPSRFLIIGRFSNIQ